MAFKNKETNCEIIAMAGKTRTAFTTAGVLAYSEKPVKGVSMSDSKVYSFSTIPRKGQAA